jgi:hypothetical protein
MLAEVYREILATSPGYHSPRLPGYFRTADRICQLDL